MAITSLWLGLTTGSWSASAPSHWKIASELGDS
jgi:hypothetical protein